MTGDMLSQEEIDALLKGSDDSTDTTTDSSGNDGGGHGLTPEEQDALGEIGNISMGTAATTLFTLLGQKVVITTPKVSVTNIDELSKEYPIPFVAVDVKYKVGLEGTNLLILRADDVKVITDLMMGGDGKNVSGKEISEMDLSAISEAMNQMVGSSSTSLSEMFMNKIDIDPPRAFEIDLKEGSRWNFDEFKNEDQLIKISFKMEVGDVIDSEIMQLIPIRFAKSMVGKLMNPQGEEDVSPDVESPQPQMQQPQTQQPQQPQMQQPQMQQPQMQQPNMNQGQNYNYQQNPPMGGNQNNQARNVEKSANVKQEPVNVQQVQFQSFDNNDNIMYNESIERIQDIPIEITVELGRTTKKISEILEYGPGTIIELDKLVGEPLEIYANSKFIARGEVVVIDDNFGIRVTDIINPSKRI